MSSPTPSTEVHTAGQSQPPPIPPAVLALQLFAVWGDVGWLLTQWIVKSDGGLRAVILTNHDNLRDAVQTLLGKLAEQCPTKPSTRTLFYSRTEVAFKDRDYAYNPFEENMDKKEPSSGKVDNCLFAQTLESLDTQFAHPSFTILIVEIKAPDTEADEITPAKALDVDTQIRRRANAAQDNGVINQHLYLIGWVGCWFRPYCWLQAESDEAEVKYEPNRNLGAMRPSKISECMFLVSRLLTLPSQAMPICATAPLASLKVLILLCGGTSGNRMAKSCYSR